MSRDIKFELKDVYNRYAKIRDLTGKPAWKIIERQYALNAFLDNKCARILEIGAGTGQDSLFFKEHGLQVTAIDLSEEQVGCCSAKGIDALAMDVYELTFEPYSFDGIYSLNCFLHIPKKDLADVLKGTHRILREGGLFYLGVYGGRDFEGRLKWTDYNAEERFFAFYTFEAYQRILESLFTVKESRIIKLNDDLTYHAFLLQK